MVIRLVILWVSLGWFIVMFNRIEMRLNGLSSITELLYDFHLAAFHGSPFRL